MTINKEADHSDKKWLEKYSSAFTLSDMEIFIFPELFYPLVVSNIMSPILWEWRSNDWFEGIEKKNFTWKANRIKQFIIQNYIFNLDLSTWGLTSKDREIERFRDFFDMELLKQSNALFGYEGDKYYFDIDIRKHFGLDKYDSEIIPYWKTESIEAMTAFRYRDNFTTGAGECVSLSALYAAAMFVVGRVPLDKIFLIATPLHSQNFINEKEGLITNNRRIVTKNMWYNGTSLSEKARRALENEKVTIVSHVSGYIHTIYPVATIDKEKYSEFTAKLKDFLSTSLSTLIFINFLRFKSKYKTLFQFECECSGTKRYIALEKLFEYEHNSRFSVNPETRSHLVQEIEGDEFHMSPLPGRIIINGVEDLLDKSSNETLAAIEVKMKAIATPVYDAEVSAMFKDIHQFILTDPKLPSDNKKFIKSSFPEIDINNTRDEILEKVIKGADTNETALLSLYIFRQMDKIDWLPFIKAAIERNPVSVTESENLSQKDVFEKIAAMDNISIYDGVRLAQPDEVWNFKRGDGIEKAILFANILISRSLNTPARIEISNGNANLYFKNEIFRFTTSKKIEKEIILERPDNTIK